VEALKAVAEWASGHLGWLCGLPFGLFVAYILGWAFVLGPRRARRSLTALASRGYVPVAVDDPGLGQAIDACFPISAREIGRGQRSSAGPSFGMALREARRTRYVLYIWRSYRYDAAKRANTQETLLIEVMDTGLAGEFEVSPFPPSDVRHDMAPVPAALNASLSGLLSVYAPDPGAVHVPEALQMALGELAPLLKDKLTKASAGIPRQLVGLRFRPDGWALSCNPFMTEPSEFDQLLRIADAIHGALRSTGLQSPLRA